MLPLSPECAIREAVRLLKESGRHFKSRQVAEARRLIEQALAQLRGGSPDAQKTDQRQANDDPAQKSRPEKTDLNHD